MDEENHKVKKAAERLRAYNAFRKGKYAVGRKYKFKDDLDLVLDYIDGKKIENVNSTAYEMTIEPILWSSLMNGAGGVWKTL